METMTKPRRGTPRATEPMLPKKVLKIVELRDNKRMKFYQIGLLMGMTSCGASHMYYRWRAWAAEQQS